MLTSFRRAAALAAEVSGLEPHFAAEIGALEHWLEACSETPPQLPPVLIAARKAATASAWSIGVSQWNRVADGRLALLRQVQRDRPLVLALLELFAADFSNSALPSGLDAAGATFPGHLILVRARLGGPLRLDGARCMASVFAGGMTTEHELTADQAQFTGPARFDEMRVARAARFAFATFMSEASFDGSVFQRELWMRHARFGGAFRMSRADARHDASFGCHFAGPASFDGTRFADTVSFESATFEGPLSLNGCRFDGLVLVEGMRALNDVCGVGAVFNGGVRPPIDLLRRGLTVRDLTASLRDAFSR